MLQIASPNNRNAKLCINTMELVEPMKPASFDGYDYTNYTKEQIIINYVSLYKLYETFKATSEEKEVRVRIYEDKLRDNGIDTTMDEEQIMEYRQSARALSLRVNDSFANELRRELSVFEDQINYEIISQLEKVKDSFRNTNEYTIVKLNHELDMLQDVMNSVYSNSKIAMRDKAKLLNTVADSIRKHTDLKTKLLGQQIQKSVVLRMGENTTERVINGEIDWNEIKQAIALQPVDSKVVSVIPDVE